VKTKINNETTFHSSNLIFAWIICLHCSFLCSRHPPIPRVLHRNLLQCDCSARCCSSFSVRSLDIILASILLLYGMDPEISAVTALLLRSVGFWFQLFVGFIGVQVLGARDLIARTPRLDNDIKKKRVDLQKDSACNFRQAPSAEHFQ
jgi:hypothetical protein